MKMSRVRFLPRAPRVSDTTDPTATTELTSWHLQYARGVCHARRKLLFGPLRGRSGAREPRPGRDTALIRVQWDRSDACRWGRSVFGDAHSASAGPRHDLVCVAG